MAAMLTFIVAAEMLFSEESGIMWAAEPHMDFFVSFIELAMHDVQLPQVKAAVEDYALRMGTSVQAATDYFAAEFMAEAVWLAAAGAPTYEPLRWILRKTPRPQAAYAWTHIQEILTDHELPWTVQQLVSRARQVTASSGGTNFWWRGQGGQEAPQAEQERMRTTWTSHALAKLSCQNGSMNGFGKLGKLVEHVRGKAQLAVPRVLPGDAHHSCREPD